MTGTKLYQKKARVYFFLIVYGILAAAGGLITAKSVSQNETPKGAAGFMMIFGAGMFVMTLVKSRRAQVSVYEDYLELAQSRMPRLVRFRHIVSVSRPDKTRLVIKLWEDNTAKNVTIWLKELDTAEVDRLEEFISEKTRKTR